jgi:hypothetical protein
MATNGKIEWIEKCKSIYLFFAFSPKATNGIANGRSSDLFCF